MITKNRHTMMVYYNLVITLILILSSTTANSETDAPMKSTNTENKLLPINAKQRLKSLIQNPLLRLPLLPPTPSLPPTLSTLIKNNDNPTDEYQADDEANYVFEDMDLLQMQNDQASIRSYTYGNIRKPLSDTRRTDFHHNSQPHRDDNLLYTEEIHTRQGPLKGIVRTMHAQSGLNSVDQYLGIPYAAPPTGSGRFMPPGKL